VAYIGSGSAARTLDTIVNDRQEGCRSHASGSRKGHAWPDDANARAVARAFVEIG